MRQSVVARRRKRSREWSSRDPSRRLNRAANDSARDDLAGGRTVAEVVDELIGAGRESRDDHRDRLAGLNDPLAMQFETFEFDRGVATVADLQFDVSVGRDG